ncbi:MAG: hypothetical protein JXC85_03710 [Candidatus Aenigmarchaeota archaeon]|nr:hypothetical protein [Candidatus Aenigmarchaeota archaeon]
MKQEERAIIIWSTFFVISGFVFMLALFFSPVIGAMITLAYIMLYVGLCAAFIIVFREIEVIKKDTIENLTERKEELEQVKSAIKTKYFKKKIDESSFKSIIQDYEKMLTEIEVKIKRLEGQK